MGLLFYPDGSCNIDDIPRFKYFNLKEPIVLILPELPTFAANILALSRLPTKKKKIIPKNPYF